MSPCMTTWSEPHALEQKNRTSSGVYLYCGDLRWDGTCTMLLVTVFAARGYAVHVCSIVFNFHHTRCYDYCIVRSTSDDPRDGSACLDIITYDEPTWYGTHKSHWSRTQRIRRHRTEAPPPATTHPNSNSGPIRIRPSLAHNSGDTHNAIQQRAQRDAHDRIHTGLTRRRSRKRAQRPANGRPEAPRAHVWLTYT